MTGTKRQDRQADHAAAEDLGAFVVDAAEDHAGQAHGEGQHDHGQDPHEHDAEQPQPLGEEFAEVVPLGQRVRFPGDDVPRQLRRDSRRGRTSRR